MRATCALLLVISLQPGNLDAQTWASTDLARSVTCTEIAFSDTAERRDRDAFARYLHPDARFVTDRVRRGPAEVASGWAPFFEPDGPSIRWRPETVEVAVSGDLALSRGPYRVVSNGAESGNRETWGSFISVWRRGDDGRWRVQFDTGGDVGMEPSDAQRRLLETGIDIDCGGLEASTVGPFDAREHVDAWVELWNTYDLSLVDELFVTDSRVTYFSSEKEGLIQGFEAIREHHRGFGFVDGGKEPESELWVEEQVVKTFGTTAVVGGVWYFGDRRRPRETVQHGPVTFVYVLEEGDYRLAHLHFANYEVNASP